MEKTAGGVEKALDASGNSLRWRSRGTLLLAGVVALYFWISLIRSGMKPLWFDELGTLNVASQPTLAGMFRVEPGDGNPPLQYLLVRACLHLLGTHALVLRLPALLGVALAIVCGYVFVARRFGTAAGLVTAVLAVFSPMSDYGVEARPYGLLLGLVGLLLVLWQEAAIREKKRGVLLVGIGLTVFAIVLTQPLGFLWVVVPLGLAEACRRWRSGQWDRGMLLAVALGLTGFAITFHFGQATQQVLVAEGGTKHPAISLPSLSKLVEALRDYGMVPLVAVLAPVGVGLWWLRRTAKVQDGADVRPDAPLHEWVAATALALTMFVIYLFTWAVTHYFWGRYLLPAMLGWALLAGMACGAAGRRWVAVAAVLVALPLSFHERRLTAHKNKPWPEPAGVYALLKKTDPKEAVVIGSPVLFDEICWYSLRELRPRLHYIADAREAEATDDFVGDLTLIAFRDAGAQMFAPDTLGFLERNPRFLLWEGAFDPGDWIKGYLGQRHYRFTQVGADANGNRLWQVEAP